MPILRVYAEGVGPFEKMDLDLTDGKGNPHLGPHILCGVNGCGKSTVLKIIARALSEGTSGFDDQGWSHLLWPQSWFYAEGLTMDGTAVRFNVPSGSLGVISPSDRSDLGCTAAYAPNRSLEHLDRPNPASERDDIKNSLNFSRTVQNEVVQGWWCSAFYKEAVAKNGEGVRLLDTFRSAVKLLVGPQWIPEICSDTPHLQPRLRYRDKLLNLSQIPDGVRNTVGWIADFLMRWEVYRWRTKMEGDPRGIILIDEIDAHLHPQWQRRILPALKKALPDVQIIVTTHSPFVVNSCPGARVHVLEVNEQGIARVRPSEEAPLGASYTATIQDIFGINSSFDPLTEQQLKEWNDLKRKEAVVKLSSDDAGRLKSLTRELAERSEELRLLVLAPSTLPSSLAEALSAIGSKQDR